MIERHIHTPPGGPPQGSAPKLYPAMGADTLYRLTEAFYHELGRSAIAAMFPENLAAASRKQAAFLIGALGGPPVYHQTYGRPLLRKRHLPFRIDESARREWLRCFRAALGDGSEWKLNPEQARALLDWLEVVSAWMVNSKK